MNVEQRVEKEIIEARIAWLHKCAARIDDDLERQSMVDEIKKLAVDLVVRFPELSRDNPAF